MLSVISVLACLAPTGFAYAPQYAGVSNSFNKASRVGSPQERTLVHLMMAKDGDDSMDRRAALIGGLGMASLLLPTDNAQAKTMPTTLATADLDDLLDDLEDNKGVAALGAAGLLGALAFFNNNADSEEGTVVTKAKKSVEEEREFEPGFDISSPTGGLELFNENIVAGIGKTENLGRIEPRTWGGFHAEMMNEPPSNLPTYQPVTTPKFFEEYYNGLPYSDPAAISKYDGKTLEYMELDVPVVKSMLKEERKYQRQKAEQEAEEEAAIAAGTKKPAAKPQFEFSWPF